MRSVEQVSGMLCPVCRTSLALSDRGGVEIDYCPSCRGVWLDRGELDKIIKRTAFPDDDRQASKHHHDRGQPGGLLGIAATMLEGEDGYRDRNASSRHTGDGDKKRKRKSLLSEFFD